MNFLLNIDSGNEHTLRNVWSTLIQLHRLLYSDNDIDQMLHCSISETLLIGIYYNLVK